MTLHHDTIHGNPNSIFYRVIHNSLRALLGLSPDLRGITEESFKATLEYLADDLAEKQWS